MLSNDQEKNMDRNSNKENNKGNDEQKKDTTFINNDSGNSNNDNNSSKENIKPENTESDREKSTEKDSGNNNDEQEKDVEVVEEGGESIKDIEDLEDVNNIEDFDIEDIGEIQEDLSAEKQIQIFEKKNELLEERIETLKEENDNYINKLQRLRADFSNYRKRMDKEKEGWSLKAKIEILEEILPIIDNFERALESTTEESELKEGVEMIYKHLINSLKQEGLKIIEAENKEFDPRYHEAIMQVEETEQPSGTVVEEMQKGYMFQDKVIRPAMVKVAQ